MFRLVQESIAIALEYDGREQVLFLSEEAEVSAAPAQVLQKWKPGADGLAWLRRDSVDIKTMSLFKVSGDRISIWLGTYEVASQVFLHSCEGWKLQFSVTKFPALLLQEKKKATNKPKPWTSGKIIITNSDDSAVVTVSDSANSTFGTKTEEFNFKK